jgi:hypothetical protein
MCLIYIYIRKYGISSQLIMIFNTFVKYYTVEYKPLVFLYYYWANTVVGLTEIHQNSTSRCLGPFLIHDLSPAWYQE